ncbi:MAG: hypothetical protein DWG76_06775 [Chloroflexi bacterium]|nr:hypothetical protein [Chloroflexota bacterium]MQC27133.1 hypothetical protein [Chloroflexota bacterium]
MNEKEELFIETIGDLKKRLESTNEYEILGISGLLRKLLIDNNPLVHQVNRNYKKKLDFEISVDQFFENLDKPGIPRPEMYFVQDGIDPETSRPGKASKSVGLQALLATPVMLIKEKVYSVKDIVKFEANVMGGVHSGYPDSSQEQISVISAEISIGGFRASLRQLKAIGRIVVRALEPLILQIEEVE